MLEYKRASQKYSTVLPPLCISHCSQPTQFLAAFGETSHSIDTSCASLDLVCKYLGYCDFLQQWNNPYPTSADFSSGVVFFWGGGLSNWIMPKFV